MSADKRTAYPVEASFPKWGEPIATAKVRGQDVDVFWTPELRELLQALYTRTGGVFDNEYEQEIIRHSREAKSVQVDDDVSRVAGRIADVESESQADAAALRIALDALEASDSENEDLRERVRKLEAAVLELGGMIVSQDNQLSQYQRLEQRVDALGVAIIEQGRANRRDLDDINSGIKEQVTELAGAVNDAAQAARPERVAKELGNQNVEGASFATETTTIGDNGVQTDQLEVTGTFTPPAGSIGAGALDANAVTTPKIADAAVTGPKINNGAVGEAQIADGAVTNTKLTTATQNKLNRLNTAVNVNADLTDLGGMATTLEIVPVVNAILETIRDHHALGASS